MRIGFLGKGGSGKTTLSAAFIEYLAQEHFVLAVDADQNINLATTLGIQANSILAEHCESVKRYVRSYPSDQPFIPTTPPTNKSTFIRVDKNDAFLAEYANIQDKIAVIQSGSYTENDIAKTCYHGKLEALEIVYHHLLDTQEDWVVADATAGLDSLGHSMYMVHDLIVYVVEPTLKSTQVCKRFLEVAQNKQLKIAIIANKLRDKNDKEFITQQLPDAHILGYIPESKHIRLLEQGDNQALAAFVDENKETLKHIKRHAKTIKKDWKNYFEKLVETHTESAKAWYDAYHKQEVSKQYNPTFSYEDHL